MKVCSRCHISMSISNFSKDSNMNDGRQTWCRACFKKYSITYRKENSEKRKAYYQNNKDKFAGYFRKYYWGHRDKVAEKTRKWKHDNRDKVAQHTRKYYLKNKDKFKIYNKRYYQKNREKLLVYSRVYRESKKCI